MLSKEADEEDDTDADEFESSNKLFSGYFASLGFLLG
jgi:hypothetical protein